MEITRQDSVGSIAVRWPASVEVFERYGIDFCCGGERSLEQACMERELDPETVLGELRSILQRPSGTDERWDQAPPADLVEHIEAMYHRPLRDELPRLEGLARKVLGAHEERHGERLRELLQVFTALRAELEDHMAKEEEILFPMIRQGDDVGAEGPIEVMEDEHQEAGRALKRLRELTGDYVPPEDACNAWRALWRGLEAFEKTMHRHIHLENNILFPKVRAGLS